MKLKSATKSKVWLILSAFLLSLMPVPALAAGGEAVKLEFSGQDYIYLYVSLGFALISLFFAYFFGKKVLKQSPGDEKMQEVGNAIATGAMAYLGQQFRTMSFFVLLLAVVLFFLYLPSFGTTVAILTSVAFIFGVLASYMAGYTGMKMAVLANMRTAAAALTSYKRSLETAFQAGAVAGLVTVGMGLLGATLIFLFAKENATKLLVGFGFGGSLAALFMRVGGGIFTKAADVGADLVGKVEAGIPEDDPRNPAVIADNVGDNVGDCAGMAADVFESYEVTLVAAIVLGAATAAIFPQEIWIKLVLFAMMARGIGILASIAGIFLVKGSDDINSDPLKAIQGGFRGSAIIAAVATAGLAYFMIGNNVRTSELVPRQNLFAEITETIQKRALSIAAEKGITINELELKDIKEDTVIRSAILRVGSDGEAAQQEQLIEQFASILPTVAPSIVHQQIGTPIDVSGFRPVDFDDEDSIVLQWAVPNPAKQASMLGLPPEGSENEPDYITLKEALGSAPLVLATVKITGAQLPAEGEDPSSVPPPQTQTQTFGPAPKAEIEQQLASQKEQMEQFGGYSINYEFEEETPVQLYSDINGDFLFAMDLGDEPKVSVLGLQAQTRIIKATAETMNGIAQKQADASTNTDPSAEPYEVVSPAQANIHIAVYRHTPAEWWRFFLCVVFGLVMAFVFEKLTDYYVGLHNRPVQELGEVSTAGPAPMIISGFAYGKESSVFSVFAIVACLIAPLLIFPPAVFGGYLLSFYGIALVGLGLLTTTGFILAMDTFGPISDNAQGVFEMSGAHHDNPEGARRVQLLDAAGNTTKALTKGFAIATAVVAAVALFHAFVEEGRLTTVGMRLEVPEIFLGMLIGGAAPYLFSAFSIQAVGRAAFELINEVRRQFREDPGIMAGTSKPDYARCVAISTSAAQRELISPGLLAIFFPVFVAFAFAIGKPTTLIGGMELNLVGAQALGGFLAGTILSGQLMAVLLANSGGMWDNAKKLIEDGLHGGKGTEAHKAAVVCDTVGDPFKDTAGPALNPLIKVMNLVALLIAPVVIQPHSQTTLIIVTLVSAAMLTIAIYLSKKGSMGSSMESAKAIPGSTSVIEDTADPAPSQEEAPLQEEDKTPDA